MTRQKDKRLGSTVQSLINARRILPGGRLGDGVDGSTEASPRLQRGARRWQVAQN